MPRSLKIVVACSFLASLVILIREFRHYQNPQTVAIKTFYQNVQPVPINAPRIPIAVLKQLVNADFEVFTNLEYIPSSVKQSFCNFEGCDYVGGKFDMVNRGDTMSTDYVIDGVSNKRLVFAALNKVSAVVVYERGGYANTFRATIIDFRDGSAWGSRLNNSRVKNMQELRAELAGNVQ